MSDLKKGYLAKLSAVHRSFEVANSSVRKRDCPQNSVARSERKSAKL